MSVLTAWRTRHRLPARPSASACVISAREVCVSLGGAPILHDVDLDVRAGQITALVGPNGAGKSTLLGVVAGDLGADTGVVTLDGEPIDRWTHTELAMRRAVLLQQVTLSFPFTVADVVAMGRAPWSGTLHEDSDDAAIAEAMRATDVEAFADRQFGTLSGGERARVALARVLAQRAPILLLDEPTAALDIHHQELVLRVARSRAAAGDAVVVVLHDLNLAAAHADRVAVLAGGRLVADGGPPDVLTGDLLSEVYRHPVDVFPHPTASTPVILPGR